MRLFVAIDIPAAVRDALDRISRRLRPLCSSARWVHIESVHVTLKFIGETPPDRIELIRAALSNARAAAPIEISFTGLGFFPNPRHPRVLWAGVTAGASLRDLAASIEAQLEPLDVPRETRDFRPHLTLARFDSPNGLDALRADIENLGTPDFGHASALEFHLYRSVLKPGGAEYTPLASYQISGEPAS